MMDPDVLMGIPPTQINTFEMNPVYMTVNPLANRSFRIYVGGSITGKSFKECVAYFEYYASKLREIGYQVYHPMLGKAALKYSVDNDAPLSAFGYDAPVSRDSEIVMRDQWMVTNADIVFMDFTETTKVSIGSCFEMAWCKMMGKKLIVVMQDDNPHQHVFVKQTAIVFDTVEKALNYLRDFNC